MNNRNVLTALAAALLLWTAGCATEGAGVDAQEPALGAGLAQAAAETAQTSPSKPATPDIDAICREPDAHAGKALRLQGRFQGFKVAKCAFPEGARTAGLTRGDWLFRTGKDCLYVTGGVPSGVDTIDPSFHGRRLELRAEVARDGDGKIYLKHLESRLLDQ